MGINGQGVSVGGCGGRLSIVQRLGDGDILKECLKKKKRKKEI